jgi:hypothetical protein
MSYDGKLPAFDVLVAFHQRDPLGYEQFRLEMLGHAVKSAAPEFRPALSRTLHAIEVARKAAKTPLEAASCAFTLMCKSLNELKGAMHELHFASAELQAIVIIEDLRIRSRHYRN